MAELVENLNYKGISQLPCISLCEALQSGAECVLKSIALIEWFPCGKAQQFLIFN